MFRNYNKNDNQSNRALSIPTNNNIISSSYTNNNEVIKEKDDSDKAFMLSSSSNSPQKSSSSLTFSSLPSSPSTAAAISIGYPNHNITTDDSVVNSNPNKSSNELVVSDTIDMIQVLCKQEMKYQKINWLLFSSQQSLLVHNDDDDDDDSFLHVDDDDDDENDDSDDNTVDDDEMVDSTCRSMMLSWCYDVLDFLRNHHHHNRTTNSPSSSLCSTNETIEITLSYIDRYMASMIKNKNKNNKKDDNNNILYNRHIYQRVFMVCFHLAMKLNEPMCMDVQLLSTLSNGIHTIKELQDMEYNILYTLNWYINPPTSLSFIHLYIQYIMIQNDFFDSTNDIELKALYDTLLIQSKQQIDYALSDSTMISIPSSIISYCSLMNSIEYCYNYNNIIQKQFIPMIGYRLASYIDTIIGCYDIDIIHIQQRLLQRCYNQNRHTSISSRTISNNQQQSQTETTTVGNTKNNVNLTMSPTTTSNKETYQTTCSMTSSNSDSNTSIVVVEKQQQQQHHARHSPCSVVELNDTH